VLLRLRRQRCACKIVSGISASPASAATRLRRSRAAARPFSTPSVGMTNDEPIGSPCFLVEEGRLTVQAEGSIERSVLFVRRQKTIDVDADVVDDAARVLVVSTPRFDVQRAAIQREHPAVVVELVALGVAAKVVVVVEDQDLAASTDVAKEEIRGRQSAQS